MESTLNINKKFLIVVAGPTASGKTSLAMTLAKKYKCEIFSADSRQIYREMNIGTAKPTGHELSEIRHHFINNKSITEGYDVGQYVAELSQCLQAYFLKHDLAILVGGTGLYIHSFLFGMDTFPDVKEEALLDLEQKYQAEGIEYLQQLLKQHDEVYYENVDLHNSRRMIRALSICLSSGKPYSYFLKNTNAPHHPYTIIPLLLHPEREKLYDNINRRVDEMIDAGLENEAQQLYPQRHLHALDTVGYREFFEYFDGHISKEEAIERIKIHSRRYAKRQVTWFKKYGEWHMVDKGEEVWTLIDERMGR